MSQEQDTIKTTKNTENVPKVKDLFERLDIRVGMIVSADVHPDADSLYVEQIDVGEAEPRTIVSGLRKFISIEDLKGTYVMVLCNLKPRKMRGISSNGMVLCASNEDHSQVELLKPVDADDVKPGDRISVDGYDCSDPDARLPPKRKYWEKVSESNEFKTDENSVATYKGKHLTVNGTPVSCNVLMNALIG